MVKLETPVTQKSNDHIGRKSDGGPMQYRRLALKFHPKCSTESEAEKTFYNIAEAYDVLSSDQRRAIYDVFGHEGLKQGVPIKQDPGFQPGYSFHGQPLIVFRSFFGCDNPFSELLDVTEKDAETGFSGILGRTRPKQAVPVEKNIFLTLKEMYNGCIKKFSMDKRVMNEDGITSSVREKTFTLTFRPGTRAGTQVVFCKEGDQGINVIPADVVFTVITLPDERYSREGDDLFYRATITLGEALIGTVIDVLMLDERIISVALTDIVRPGYQKRVLKEGMPIPEQPGARGDLIICFDITFPDLLDQEQKAHIRMAFPKNVTVH